MRTINSVCVPLPGVRSRSLKNALSREKLKPNDARIVEEEAQNPFKRHRKVQQQAWTEAFAKKSADAFQKSLAQDVVLEANTLVQPVEGIDQVKIVMATASAIYEELVFTQEASNGPRTYLEWQARALSGIELFGVTVLLNERFNLNGW